MLPLLLAVALSTSIAASSAAASETAAQPESHDRSTHYYLGFFTAGSWVTADPSGTAVTPGTDTDHSFFWGANLGAEMPVFRDALDLRLELEGTNERKYHFDTPASAGEYSSDIQAWTFMGNFWFVYPLKKLWPDTPVVNRISPFGGGGIGLSRNTFDTVNAGGGVSGSDRSVTFAWQGGVGLSFDVVRWLTLDLRYQYIDLGKQSVSLQGGGGGELELDLGGNEIVGGLRFVY